MRRAEECRFFLARLNAARIKSKDCGVEFVAPPLGAARSRLGHGAGVKARRYEDYRDATGL
jgi:hypothetical protein